MKKTILVFAVGLLTACGGEVQDNDAVDFEDFAGNTGVEVDSSDSEGVEELSFDSQIDELSSRLDGVYDTVAHNDFHPMDRFSFSSSQKLQFTGMDDVPYGSSGTTVTPKAQFFYYSFADTNKTINAFYNYLDQMADDSEGGPVKLNQDLEAIKMPPMFMAVYDTIIVTAKYMCEHEENDWDSFQDSILQVYGTEYKYYIDVDCGGPLSWK